MIAFWMSLLRRQIIYALLAICFLYELCIAERPPNYSFMYEATNAPINSSYDYIIIGGGTTGIPLAITLSAKYKVLLLERGGSPYGNPNITNIGGFGSNLLNASPDSPSQQFVSTEGVQNTRARVLGGGTCINAGFYSHGEQKFNKEARFRDAYLIRRSYKWVEKVMVHKPVVQKWQSALRAALVEARVTPDNGFTYDHIIGTKVGGTTFDENGTRHSAADLLQYANPQRLTVLLHSTAYKIQFKTKGRSKPLAYGVEFKDSLGHNHIAYLKGGKKDEIILSAGAIGSPQLLILSGIGPKDQLDAHQIKVVLHQPFVGKDMADNPRSSIFIPSPIPVELSLVQVVGITQFGSYIEEVSRLNLVFADLSRYQGFSPEMGGFVAAKINGPLSKGEMKILSCNPADNPSVTFNYYKEPTDLRKCVLGVRTILNAIESKSFYNFKYANMTTKDILNLSLKLQVTGNVNPNKRSFLERFCKNTIATMWHYHGGCLIDKVIDHEYKVLGVDALRVIDASTLLNSPGTNPQASLLMLGRYMGVKIVSRRYKSQ